MDEINRLREENQRLKIKLQLLEREFNDYKDKYADWSGAQGQAKDYPNDGWGRE